MIWQFLDTGLHTGAYNMALDEQLAREVGAGTRPSVLRFFQWQPYCISLGKHQRMDDIDTARAQAEGIDVVYRPTGGRAILHAEELTYSVVFKNEITGTVEETYRLISEALVQGLRAVGVDAAMNPAQPNFRQWYTQPVSKLCFSSSARHEIQVDGRKLVGSAQRRLSGAVLQHGSILLGSFHRRLPEFLNVPEPAKIIMRQMMDEKTIEIGQITSVNLETLKTAIRQAFAEVFSIEFHEAEAP